VEPADRVLDSATSEHVCLAWTNMTCSDRDAVDEGPPGILSWVR
jgi:hypothetical protein